jgi:lipoprotein-anchoring transpeptidase ErfK/SrfK
MNRLPPAPADGCAQAVVTFPGRVLAESRQVEVTVERFERVGATDRHVLLRLGGTCPVPESGETPVWSRLIAETGSEQDGWAAERRELWPIQKLELGDATGSGWRWSCAFAAPSVLLRREATRFVLVLDRFGRVELPAPTERTLRPARPAPSVAARLGQQVVRVFVGVLCGGVIGVTAWAAVSVIEGNSQPAVSAHRALLRTVTPAPRRPAVSRPGPAVPPGESLVAQARVTRAAVYRSADAKSPEMVLSNPNPDGALLVFLVTEVGPTRLRVLLPTRPNLSQGWISRGQMQLAFDPYRLDVHLRSHLMTVSRGGRLIERDPVGVGRRAITPTPFGVYYVTELLKQPDPSGIYGPYAFGLSAHSDVLHEFAGGNGEIGIHGTNEPWAVGTDVSHGCIRVYNSVITRLARELPLGTPVQIQP